MFKSVPMGLATLTLLSSECTGKKVSFRPPSGTVPWHKKVSQSSWEAPTWKTDYVVPNFGAQDTDVSGTQASNSAAEKSLGHVMAASFSTPKPPPRDYFVPNFGADKDIIDAQSHIAQQESKHGTWTPVQDSNGAWTLPSAHAQLLQLQDDPICNSSGCTQYKHPKQKDDHPMDYYVADFGKDHDLSHNDASLNTAETMLGHKWKWTKATDDVKKDYFVPNFGMDKDIADSLKNLKGAVNTHGSWDLPKDDWYVQTEEKSDPIQNSSGDTQYLHPHDDTHPKDYFVPDFGKDKDMHTNDNSLDWAEQQLGHKWNWKKKDDKDAIEYNQAPKLDEDVVTSQVNLKSTEKTMGKVKNWKQFADVQLEADVSITSDPICDSSGCNQYKHKKKDPGYDKDYPVVDLGVDKDIIGAHEDLAVAEGIVKHKLIMGTDESKAKWENKAKKTDYDYSPKLDKDMHDAATNLDLVEGKLGHKYEPWTFVQTDVESDPICSSAGCNQYKHPKKDPGYDMDYPVVNLGVDKDIIGNNENLPVAEKIVGHHWIWDDSDRPKKIKYDYSPKLEGEMIDAAKNLDIVEGQLNHKYASWMLQLDDIQNMAEIEVQAKSDPICSSAGCWKSDYTKKMDDKIVQYPQDGLDSDVRNTLAHEEKMSEYYGHTWDADTIYGGHL